MFRRKGTVAHLQKEQNASLVEDILQETIRVIKPQPTLVKEKVDNLTDYETLARKLDFYPAALLEQQLLNHFAEGNIPLFNYDEVDRYLRDQIKGSAEYWIWRPLRSKDKPDGWHWGPIRRNHNWDHNGSYKDGWAWRPYDKSVPLYILEQVHEIESQFDEGPLFFVSDYAVSNPDPFIMVTALDVKRIVFGMWDEPNFG